MAAIYSALHRLESAEVYHFYAGAPRRLLLLPDGRIEEPVLGRDYEAGHQPQVVVPKGVWQGSRSDGPWSLTRATMAPGFRHDGFEFPDINAGIQPAGAWSDARGETWDAVMNANARSVECLIRAALPAPSQSDGGAAIVHIASVRAERPGTRMAHYSASKAAVLALTRGLAGELGPKGIRVNAISPGLVERPGLAESWPKVVARCKSDAPLGRLGQPADVASACLFLVSPAAAWITGLNLVVDGRISLVR